MKTLDLHAAAELLHLHPVTLRDKARLGEVPGAKIGKCWVFVDVDLIDYIRAQYPSRVMQGDRQEKTPLHVLQELGGWESVEMVRRYAHLSSEHLADYVDRLSGLRTLDGVGGYDLATVPEMKRG